MNLRKITLAAAAVAALAPAISDATPEKDAINACARAFASSLSSNSTAAPTYKVVYGGHRYVTSIADTQATEYLFDLLANDKAGAPMARASCSTDSHGAVIALSPVPLTAAPRTLSAQD
jgi:hypothetical protein